MERKKSLLAATIISATLLTGAVAYAASSGVIEGRDDNVGNLQPTTAQTKDITVFVDPVTGSVTTTPTTTTTPTAPAAAVTAPTSTRSASAAVSTTRTTIDDHGGDRVDDDNSGSGSSNSGPGSDNSGSDDSGSDDRRHGRGSDDD